MLNLVRSSTAACVATPLRLALPRVSGCGMAVGALTLAKYRSSFCEAHTKPLKVPKLAEVAESPPKVSRQRTQTRLLASMLSAHDWVLLGVSAFCSILASLLTTVQARVVGRLFDSMGVTSVMGPGLARLLIVFSLQAVLSFAGATALSAATTNFGVRLRVSFFSAIIKQDMAVLDERKTGELTHQLSQDVASLQTAMRESFTRGIESVTSLISGSILLYSVSPSMSFYLLSMLPLGAVAGTWLGEALRHLSKQSREAANRATGLAAESISSIRTIRAFAAESREITRYEAELERGAGLKTKMAALSGGFYAAIGLGINLTTLLICGWGHSLIEKGVLTKGDIATVVTQVQLLERSLARLSVLSASLSKAMKSSEHIFDLILTPPRVNRAARDALLLQREQLRGDIEFRSVSFSYPSRPDALALDDVSLIARQGETVALVGASGSGKSTIFALVERFYDPDTGSVTIDGHKLSQLDPRFIRQQIGYVPQKPELFSGSIGENIRYGKPTATQAEVEEAARQANAHDFIAAFPDGYNTLLGDSGNGLSGGQRQRIAIARSLLLDPKILLLDEITSGLDSDSEFLVSQALDKLMKGRTTLIIAHRLNTVKNAARVYVVEDGRIVESGPHEELVAKANGAYRAFWEKQNRGLRRANSNVNSER